MYIYLVNSLGGFCRLLNGLYLRITFNGSIFNTVLLYSVQNAKRMNSDASTHQAASKETAEVVGNSVTVGVCRHGDNGGC